MTPTLLAPILPEWLREPPVLVRKSYPRHEENDAGSCVARRPRLFTPTPADVTTYKELPLSSLHRYNVRQARPITEKFAQLHHTDQSMLYDQPSGAGMCSGAVYVCIALAMCNSCWGSGLFFLLAANAE
jgi:hypothetical protein